jgi:hypothetical protein
MRQADGGVLGLSLLDVSVGIGGIPPEVVSGGAETPAERQQRAVKKTAQHRRRNGFLGPIFNGGRKGWARGLRFVISGLGLIFSPLRLGWDIFSTVTGFGVRVGQFLTPGVLGRPLGAFYAKVAKTLWVRVGVKMRRIWRRYEGPWAWRAFWNAVPELWRAYFPFVDESHVRPEAEALRAAFKLVEAEEGTLRDRIAVLEKSLNGEGDQGFGPGGVFSELNTKCVSARFQGYSYEVCPFRTVKQQGTTNLGKWKGYGDFKDSEDDKTPREGSVPAPNPAVDAPLTKEWLEWWFVGGTKCYNGPKRRSKVTVKCGPKHSLDNVYEPEVCFYMMEMSTPAACDPRDLDPEFARVEDACWDKERATCVTGGRAGDEL